MFYFRYDCSDAGPLARHVGKSSQSAQGDADAAAQSAASGPAPAASSVPSAAPASLPENSLRCLTVAHLLTTVRPSGGGLEQVLDGLEDLYLAVLHGHTLPDGERWLDPLVAAGLAVRSDTPFPDLAGVIGVALDGFCVSGLKVISPEYPKAQKILSQVGLDPTVVLVPHELVRGRARLAVTSQAELPALAATAPNPQAAVAALKMATGLYDRYPGAEGDNARLIVTLATEKPPLAEVARWWDGQSRLFSITPAGDTLARAHALELFPALGNKKKAAGAEV